MSRPGKTPTARLNLARKYRPQQLDDVQGQPLAVKILSEAIKQDRIGPAYVFSGPRGSGKTTCARIFGRAAACLSEKPTSRPCGTCPSCVGLSASTTMDLLEIDGASHTSVDDVRSLIEKVAYRPSTGRRSIFIIDEVHMLSNAAFNALLKTLEEPPAHVLFLFATTEQEKIPDTILSRCQRIQLKRLSEVEMLKNLRMIAAKEQIECGDASLEKIAAAADGSLRDAQTLFEQTILLSGGSTVSEEVTATFLGTIGSEQELKLLDALARQSTEELLRKSQEFSAQGKDLALLSQRLLGWLRALLIMKSLHAQGQSTPERVRELLDTEFHDDYLKQLTASFESWSVEDVDRLYEVISSGLDRIRKSEIPHASFEITLLRASRIPRTEDLRFLVQQLRATPGALAVTAPSATTPAHLSMSPSSAKPAARSVEKSPTPDPPPPARAAVNIAPLPEKVEAGDLTTLLAVVARKRPSLHALLLSKSKADWTKNELSFEFPKGHFAFKQLSEKILIREFQNLVREITGNPKLEIQVSEAGALEGGSSEAPKAKPKSFFSEAKKLATEDPTVLEVQRILGGQIESITIEGVKNPVASKDSRPL